MNVFITRTAVQFPALAELIFRHHLTTLIEDFVGALRPNAAVSNEALELHYSPALAL